jgi:hypothetical protein
MVRGAEDTPYLSIHHMVVLSTLRYGETVYGSASIESVHHKEVKIALGVFAICKMENAFCEAGLPKMRKLNATMVAVRILTNKKC